MRLQLMATAAIAALFSTPVSAQDEPTAIEEIIVTAQKRDESLLSVPISITAVTAATLDAASARNLSEVQGRVPGVYFSAGAGGAAPIGIRGTAGSGTPLGDEPVAVYLDGIYLARNSLFASSDLLDVSTVEVVRGPQGTLQGRNATAGAILVRSADPRPEFGGFFKGSIADPTEYRAQLVLTGPLGENLAGRIALGHTDDKGWAFNTYDGSRLGSARSNQVRGVLLWQATPRLLLRPSADFSRSASNAATARWAQTNFSPLPTGPLYTVPTPTVPLSGAERKTIEDDHQFALNRPNGASGRSAGASLEATFSFADVDLVSLSGWRKLDSASTADSDGMARTDRDGFNDVYNAAEQYSQELRLQSTGDAPLSWILGAYAYHEKQTIRVDIINLGLTGPGRTRMRFASAQKTTSYAAFADATWKPSSEWAFSAGIRYSAEEKDFTLDRQLYLYGSGAPLGPPLRFRPETANWTDVSYRAKAAYTPTDDVLVYASYSKGFKSGGFNAFGSDPAYDPETLTSAEVGAKLRLRSLGGYVAASAYWNVYDDLQLRAGVPEGGIIVFNAASSTIKGFEIEGQVRPLDGLTLDANVAYTDATFDDFKAARDVLDRPVDASGNRLPRTPEWQFFLGAAYERQLSEEFEARGELSYSWRDTIFLYQTNQDSPAWQGEPLTEIGARLTFTHLPSDLKFGLFGRNLTDDRAVANVSVNFSYPIVTFNRPRSVGIFLEKRF
ncbi:MAG: TonB-dependent receptor [Phenylobacterium sp.]|nr:TonB-dependent receptor [Phenylobacterium sp.]